jgi:excisionase family DNA binding protein
MVRFVSVTDSDLITPRVAAGRLGVTVKTLRRWVELGELTSVRTPGGHYRYHADQIEAIRTGDEVAS